MKIDRVLDPNTLPLVSRVYVRLDTHTAVLMIAGADLNPPVEGSFVSVCLEGRDDRISLDEGSAVLVLLLDMLRAATGKRFLQFWSTADRMIFLREDRNDLGRHISEGASQKVQLAVDGR